MPSTIYSVKSIGFTQPALLFSNLVCMPILCVSLQTMLQKKKKRLKKGNKKKDNHKTKYYKTNKLSVLKSKITELQLSLYVKPSEAQRTEKIINYYSLGEWQKGFRVYWARTSQFLKFHAVQRFPDMILASEEIEFQKWRKREVTLRRGRWFPWKWWRLFYFLVCPFCPLRCPPYCFSWRVHQGIFSFPVA